VPVGGTQAFAVPIIGMDLTLAGFVRKRKLFVVFTMLILDIIFVQLPVEFGTNQFSSSSVLVMKIF